MKKVIVDESKCIRCGACMHTASDVFTYGSDGESVPLVETVSDDNKNAILAMECCPTGAITLEEIDDDATYECENCDCDHCECGESCDCGDNCECGDECSCEDCHCDEKAA